MRIKDGVVLPPMNRLQYVADLVFLRHAGREAICTAGLDGQHKTGSRHYKGHALDFRTNDLRPDQIAVIATELEEQLGRDFDVVIHKTHIHCEYDPKGDKAKAA